MIRTSRRAFLMIASVTLLTQEDRRALADAHIQQELHTASIAQILAGVTRLKGRLSSLHFLKPRLQTGTFLGRMPRLNQPLDTVIVFRTLGMSPKSFNCIIIKCGVSA
jgi:hypothetical protein